MAGDNQLFPPTTGGEITYEQAQTEMGRFREKYGVNRPEFYALNLEALINYLANAEQQGATQLAVLNTLNQAQFENSYCCLSLQGEFIDLTPQDRAGLEAFRTAHAASTRIYSWGIEWLTGILNEAFQAGNDQINFYNGTNSDDQDTMMIFFTASAYPEAGGAGDPGGQVPNDPFLCPPICPG